MYDPLHFVRELLEHAGVTIESVVAEPVSRRGTTVVRLLTNLGDVALKLSHPATETAEMPTSGTEALRVEARLFVKFGRVLPWPLILACAETPWVLSSWQHGPSSSSVAADLRGRKDWKGISDLARGMLAALVQFHERGIVHGDLQPRHFVQKADTWVVLDFGAATCGDIATKSYLGGLVHYNAPEICAAVLQGRKAPRTFASDMFAFGATVYLLSTGQVLGAYDASTPSATPWREKLEILAKGQFREIPAELGRFGKFIQMAVSIDPAARFSSASSALSFLKRNS